MGQRTLVPDAREVVLHEVRAVGRIGLVKILWLAGEEGRCPTCAPVSGGFTAGIPVSCAICLWEGIPVRRASSAPLLFRRVQCGQHIITEGLPNVSANLRFPRFAG